KDFCSEFGLTPAARSRIKVDVEEQAKDDPMAELLSFRC
ncbi:MAG: phage terminase small subunit P27 family, partial [Clostridia bacterium]|nr:phage terminase small subunit P27 family [Clostridia bacterium]